MSGRPDIVLPMVDQWGADCFDIEGHPAVAAARGWLGSRADA